MQLIVRDTVPLCSAQYERLFGTTRIPGKPLGEFDVRTYVHIGGLFVTHTYVRMYVFKHVHTYMYNMYVCTYVTLHSLNSTHCMYVCTFFLSFTHTHT